MENRTYDLKKRQFNLNFSSLINFKSIIPISHQIIILCNAENISVHDEFYAYAVIPELQKYSDYVIAEYEAKNGNSFITTSVHKEICKLDNYFLENPLLKEEYLLKFAQLSEEDFNDYLLDIKDDIERFDSGWIAMQQDEREEPYGSLMGGLGPDIESEW